MRVPWGRTILAGILATVVMTLIMMLGQRMGIRMNMPLVLGGMFGPPPENLLLGYVVHFTMGVIFAVLYALVFAAIGRSGAGTGATLGLLHGTLAGIVMGFMPIIHPNMGPGEAIPPLGFFAVNLGLIAAVMLIAVHMIWGAIVGAVIEVPVAVRAERGRAAPGRQP